MALLHAARTSRSLFFAALVIALGGPARSLAIPVVSLSGTVQYTGQLGPVSGQRPLVIYMNSSAWFDGNDVDQAVVATNGGAFTLQAPAAGDYYLVAGLDLNGDGEINIGEPFEMFNNRFAFPGDPVAVPGAGVNVSFGDTARLPGIAGHVTYTGSQPGPTRLHVLMYADDGLTEFEDEAVVYVNGGGYEFFTDFDNRPRYLVAYLDLNDNGEYDDAEPYEIYDNRADVPADPVLPAPAQDRVDFHFGDLPTEARLTGTVTFTGAASVSRDRPILLFLSDDPNSEGDFFERTTVAVNGGGFVLGVPGEGDYYLACVLDLNGNGDVDVGEPYEIYDGRPDFPGDPIAVPQPAVALSFGDGMRLSGIAGSVTYTGDDEVSYAHPLIVESFTDSQLTQDDDWAEVDVSGGAYHLITLDTQPYYLRVFLDRNGNLQLDPGEPVEIFDTRNSPPGNAVTASPTRTGVDFVFGPTSPQARLTGAVQYNGSRGPVSTTRPIGVYLADDANFDNIMIDAGLVTSNGGNFILGAPDAGPYYFAAVLQANIDRPAVGDPFQIYKQRTDIPGDPLSLPKSIAVTLTDGGLLKGVAGTVTYTGRYQPVGPDAILVVESFTNSALSGSADDLDWVVANGGRYDLITFDTANRYLRAFLDLNGNETMDDWEPFRIFPDRAAPPALPIVPSSSRTGVDFQFGDENVSVAGFVRYTGALGPVSPARPLVVAVFDDPYLRAAWLDAQFLEGDGARFDLAVRGPGRYYLMARLDLDNDGLPSVGEPFVIFDERSGVPADVVLVPGPLSNAVITDSRRLSGIGGTVTYTGSQGSVSDVRRLIVQAFHDAALTDFVDQSEKTVANGGRYDILTGNTPGTYYVRAFFDLNDDRAWQSGEPFEVYLDRGAGQGADPIVSGPDQTAIDFAFGDTPPPTRTPTATGTPTSTPTPGLCVGDCRSDGRVTVDELVKGIDIALGLLPLAQCPASDPDHDGVVTVDELVRAAGAALYRCVGPVP